MSGKLKRLSLSVLLAVLFTAAVAIPAASPQPSEPVSVFDNFVTRNVDVLMDGDQEYRFLSAATPTLQIVEDNYPFEDRSDFEWRWPDEYEIRDTLETIRQMGGQATRIYCLSVKRSTDRPGTPRHIVAPASLPDGSANPDAFNEEGFRVLDQVLATANELGVRIVIPITNQFPWHGGYTDIAALRGIASNQFWTNADLRADFKAITNYLLNRTNTITGVQYKDDKAILAWAYGNELNSATVAWINEMGAYIRSIDPNHLIMHHTTRSTLSPTTQLNNAYVDIAATSIYDNFQNVTVPRIISQKAQATGLKPYVTFEFGFAATTTLEQIMNTIISTGTSGGQMWGLRPHNREGGFYWHGEEASGALYLLRSYHWPGYPSGERYDESIVMNLLRNKAYEIRGLTAPPLEAPAAPTLLPIDSPAAISWQGSTGARSYILERATSADGPWTTLNDEVYDDVAYTPVYNDNSAAVGESYFYRVSAQNETGVSPASNVVGPVLASSRSIVDNVSDLSQLRESTPNLVVEQRNNRTVLERLSRIVRSSAVGGEHIVYEIDGKPNSFRVFSFFQAADSADFTFATSQNGVDYEPLTPTVSRYGEGPGVYGYWYRVLYSGDLPANARYLKIEFPNLENAASPALSRVEIEYDPAPVASNDADAGGAVVQYSDALSPAVTVSASDPNSPGSALTATAAGLPTGFSLAIASTDDGVPGARTWTVEGTVDGAPGIYPVDVTVTDEEGNAGKTSFSIEVVPEDAEATYTGDELVFGKSSMDVQLRATVRDSSLLGTGDDAAGDVTNASVTFVESSTVLCGPLAVELVGGEPTVGTAACTVALDRGAHQLDVLVGDFYAGSGRGTADVVWPGDDRSVSGAGHIRVDDSAGAYAATADSRLGLTFNGHYSWSHHARTARLHGHASVIFKAGDRRYEIESTALESLGIDRKNAGGGACANWWRWDCVDRADLRFEAKLLDVTKWRPSLVARDLTLRITATDPIWHHEDDAVGITLWDGNTLLLSSEWTGAATIERLLRDGNISVH